MKKSKILIVVVMVTAMLASTGIANAGAHHGNKAYKQKYNCSISACKKTSFHTHKYCPIKNCTVTKAHKHNKTYYKAHKQNDGHTYHKNCNLNECPKIAQHKHVKSHNGNHHGR